MAGRQWVLSGTVAGVMAVMLWACGGDSSPTGPSDGGGGGGGGTRVETDTITITSTGVSPRDIIVNSGTTVKFVNNDSGSHEPSSNPHPAHTDCPDLNVGTVAPGATGTSGPMPSGRTCGFHDHLFPETGSLQGSVQVR
jgi:plastocyanin